MLIDILAHEAHGGEITLGYQTGEIEARYLGEKEMYGIA
jgi:hypothetical protein